MPQPELKPAHVGQFACSLNMLRDIMGFPEHIRIVDVSPVPFAIHGQPAVRFVVEDPMSLPAVQPGQEVLSIAPQFKHGGDTYREFQGWGDEEELDGETGKTTGDNE